MTFLLKRSRSTQGYHFSNFSGPMSSMLHIKSQGHWPFGSGEEDFKKGFNIYGRGGHLGHVTQMWRTNFHSVPNEAPYETWLWLARWFLRRRRLTGFPCMSLCKISDPWGWAFFELRALIWTVFIEFYKIKLHTKYQRPGPSSFKQEDFFKFCLN